MTLPQPLSRPEWQTGIATLVSYGILLAVITLVLFGLPYGIFVVLA